MKRMIRSGGAIAVLLFAACTTVDVVREYSGTSLPRPERVLVYDLAVTPDEVKLDSGLSAMAVEAMKGSSRTEQEVKTGHDVAAALSKHLVKEIQDMGLPAQRADGPPSEDPNDLSILGHFLSIDEGNRTARVVIGLGAGRTDVKAEVQLYQNSTMIEELEADSKSGRNPGAAETMGVGAATGNLLTSAVVTTGVQGASEAFVSSVESDASRAAKQIAKKIMPFFVRQHWIPGDQPLWSWQVMITLRSVDDGSEGPCPPW